MRPLIFALTLSFVPLALPLVMKSVSAQETPPQTAEVRPDAILKGEIGLEGRIKAINGPGAFDIAASSFTTDDGRTIEFDEAKPKSIQAVENAVVVPGDDLKVRLAMKDVKLGLRVRLIGRNVNGQPFQARVIILSDVSSKYQQARGVQMTMPVAIAVSQGAKFFDAGDFNRALTFFKQAQGMAAGANDKNGLASSLARQGMTYRELNQPQKAEEAYKQALAVAENGSPDSLMIVLANYGSLLQSLERTKEAIPFLERARTRADGESDAIQVLLGRNLASAYAGDQQWDKAISAWNSIISRQRAQGKVDEEIATLLNVAAAQLKAKRPEENAKTFAVAQERFKAVTDPAQRAASQAAFGAYYVRIDNKVQASPWFQQALTGFETLNDARSAASIRLAIEALNKPAAPETPAAPGAPAAPESADM